MKKLKRVLALALTLAMCLSLVTVASAAGLDKFSDAGQVVEGNKTAVEVVTGLKIINGTSETTLNPNGDLKRSEAAKIMAVARLGVELSEAVNSKTAETGFADANGDWFSGYIAYGVAEGYLAGFGDGTFRPKDSLTGAQFGKMLLNALNYGLTYDNNGDVVGNKYEGETWAIRVVVDAKAVGLLKDMNVNLNNMISRQDAMHMLFNALLLSDENDYVSDEFEVTKVDTNVADELGAPAVKYVAADGNTVLATETQKPLKTITDGKVNDADLKDYTIAANVPVVYNGGVTNTDADEYADLNGKLGYTVSLYGDPGAPGAPVAVTKIVVTEYSLAKIDAVAQNGDITLKVGAADITVAAPATPDAPESDDYKALKGYAKDTYLNVLFGASNKVLDVKTPATVEGKVTKLNTTAGKVTIGSKEYTFANKWSAPQGFGIGTEGTFYLEPNGNVIGFSAPKAAPAEKNVVYAVAPYTVSESDTDDYGTTTTVKTYYVQAVDMKGAVVNYQVKEADSKIEKGLYEVEVKPGKDVNDVEANYATLTLVTPESGTVAVVPTDIKVSGTNNYFASDVKVIYIGGEKGTLKVTVKDGVQKLDANKYVYLTKEVPGDNTNKTVSTIIVTEAYKEPEVAGSSVMYVPGTGSTVTSNVEVAVGPGKGYEHVVYVDGVETHIVSMAQTLTTGFVAYTVKDDVYTISGALTKENLKAATPVTNMYNGLLSTNVITDVPAINATVVNLTDSKDVPTDATKLSTDDTVALVLSQDGKTVVTVYVTATTRGAAAPGPEAPGPGPEGPAPEENPAD